MKSSTHKSTCRHRAPAVLIFLGTTGITTGTHLAKHEEKFGIPRTSRVPVLAVETAESARTYSASLGPGLPSVALPEESFLILQDRSTQQLGDMAARHPKTRRYAEKIMAMPATTTKEGAGGNRMLALLAFLAELPELDQRIQKLLAMERDRCRFAAQCDEGNGMSGSDVMDVYLVGSGYGATCSGSALLVASRIQHHARLAQLKVRIHLILVSPSVAKTHDPLNAWANFAITCKGVLKAMEDASKIIYHTFEGTPLTHQSQSKLLDTFAIWGSSTGSLMASDREEVAASISLLLFYLVHSSLAGVSEAAFCDSVKKVSDRSLGFRGFRRLGLVRFAVDQQLNRTIAHKAALQQITEMMTSPTN